MILALIIWTAFGGLYAAAISFAVTDLARRWFRVRAASALAQKLGGVDG